MWHNVLQGSNLQNFSLCCLVSSKFFALENVAVSRVGGGKIERQHLGLCCSADLWLIRSNECSGVCRRAVAAENLVSSNVCAHNFYRISLNIRYACGV